MWICNGSCKGRTLIKDKHTGRNTYQDSTWSGVTNPDHPWENPMHSLDEGRLYVPESNLLRMEVIQKHHDFPVAGHPGYKKTLDLLQHNYYWPGWPQQSKNISLDVTHAKDSRDLTWPKQASYTHLKPRHYHESIAQLISSQTFPFPTALMQSWRLLISSQKK